MHYVSDHAENHIIDIVVGALDRHLFKIKVLDDLESFHGISKTLIGFGVFKNPFEFAHVTNNFATQSQIDFNEVKIWRTAMK